MRGLHGGMAPPRVRAVPGLSGRRHWLLSAALALAGCRRNPDPPLTLACAASLRDFMETALRQFGGTIPGCEIRTVYGASGSLVSQVRGRAPFSLLLAADMDGPAALAAEGLTDPPFRYADGGLDLWLPAGPTPAREGLGCLLQPSVQKIALANPQTAPYGRAAMEALQSSGLVEALRPKLVYGSSVSEAAHFVRSGAASAGLVPRSLRWPPAHAWPVPATLHEPIRHAGIMIPWGPRQQEAALFRDWLLSDEAAPLLPRHGLSLPAAA